MNDTIGIVVRDEQESVFAMPEGFSVDGPCLYASTPDWEGYERLGKLFSAYHRHASEELPWLIGDFINIGADLFPDRYEQAVEFSGWAMGTILNYATAAKKVPPENRKVGQKTLPIRMGMNITILPAKEQERVLKKADKEGLTVTEVRRLARGDPDYKRPALPQSAGNAKDRVRAMFDRVYVENQRFLDSLPRKEAGQRLWEICSDYCWKLMR